MRKLIDASHSPAAQKSTAVGQSARHESAIKHVSGTAVYVDDIVEPKGMLHAYPVFSSIAKGRILSIDLSSVRCAPGVVAVITKNDVPGLDDIGPVFPGDPLFLDVGDMVEFSGQVICAVAATSFTAARKAARLAKIEYTKERNCLDIESGLQGGSFVRPTHTQSRGDVDQIISSSDICLEGSLRIGGQEHMYLEGQVSLAIPTEDGGIVLHSSSQNPTEAQKLVAEVLAIPFNCVTVETRRMGGGFGGKETSGNHWSCIAA